MKSLFYEPTKRAFDVISSSIAIIILSPIWLLIAIGIKLSSKGPVFYKAVRIGKNQKTFTLYKFRSMHMYDPSANDKKEKSYLADESRIFKFGGFLRSSKLDELPQLINVLKGQMSVIGPRPMSEIGAKRYYIGKYECIYDVKPGLACLDSLYDYAHGELFSKDETEFRNIIFPTRTELARIYVQKRSIYLDLYCIIRTIMLITEIAILKRNVFPYTKYERTALKRVSKP